MKNKIISIIIILALAIGAMNFTSAFAVDNEIELDTVVELENINFNSPLSKVRDTTAGGNRCLIVDGNSTSINNNTDDSNAEISVYFSGTEGTKYYVWLKYLAKDSAADSVWVAHNDSKLSEGNVGLQTTGEGLWLWKQVLSFEGKSGKNNVRLTHRESGTKFDSIVVSSNAGYVPPDQAELQKLIAKSKLNSSSDEQFVVTSGTPTEFKDGVWAAEAEDIIEIDSECMTVYADTLSGGKGIIFKDYVANKTYVSSNPLSVFTKGPVLKMTVDVTEDGGYAVWMRYNSTSDSTNSVYACFNNKTPASINLAKQTEKDEYNWVSLVASEKLSKGLHTFNIYPREYGLMIDKIVMVNAGSGYMPSGMGENTVTSEIVYHTDIKPKTERPRVWINKSDIPDIIENSTHPENAPYWAEIEEYVNTKLDDGFATYDINQAIKWIESKALWYVLYGDKNIGREAIDGYNRYRTQYLSQITTDYNSRGEATYLTGLVYDWCNDLLTANEKLSMQNSVISLNKGVEISWPPTVNSTMLSHSAEGLLMRDMLTCAIAMYGDRDDIYQNVAGRFFSEYTDARKFFYAGGYFNPGFHYMGYRNQWEAISSRLIEKGFGIEHVYGKEQVNNAYTYIYAQRPDGGPIASADGSYNKSRNGIRSLGASTVRIMMHLANQFNDPYLKYQQMRFTVNGKLPSGSQNQMITPVEFVINNNPDVEAISEKALPLTRYMGGNSGVMIARTGWEEGIKSQAVVAEMKIGMYQMNEHQHLDAGGFQIYYKGGLANDTGYYQAVDYSSSAPTFTINGGNTAYGTAHDVNYNTRTIAHNCMLVHDPNETFPVKIFGTYKDIENDGGQTYTNDGKHPYTAQEIRENEDVFKVGEVLAHEYGEDAIEPDYSYLKGDISNAYSDKVSEYERSFMFLNLKNDEHPAAMIVFDRIKSSNPEFKKTWLLHTKNNPTVTGNRAVATVTDNGYNGKITLDVMGGDKKINVVEGGPGDAWVNGTNYYATVGPDAGEGGGARIEVSPKEANELDYFLNVMQVGDADGKEALPVTEIKSDTHMGAVVSDRVVAFAKQRDRFTGDISFSFEGNGEYKITLADCKAGTWQIEKDGAVISTASATGEGGVLSFSGTPGSYKITYLNDTVTKLIADPDARKVITEDELKLDVNQKRVLFENDMILGNGISYIPADEILKYLGYDVSYNPASKELTASKPEEILMFTADKNVFIRNKSLGTLKTTPIEVNGCMYLPARFYEDVMQGKVYWNGTNKIIYLEGGMTGSSSKDGGKADIISAIGPDGQSAPQVFDQNAQSSCIFTGQESMTLEFDKAYSLDTVMLMFANNSLGKTGYKIDASLDGKTWTEFVPETYSIGGIDNYYDYISGNGVKAKYLKITVRDGAVCEIEASGSVIDTSILKIIDCQWSGANGGEIGTNTYDNNPATLWSVEGIGSWISWEMDDIYEYEGMEIIWNNGDKRVAYFDILVSNDGENWTAAISNASTSGTNAGFERVSFAKSVKCKFIKIVANGNSTSNWNAIKEVKFIEK